MNRYSHLIHHARRQANLSLRDLAKRAATSHATLSAYEHGRKVPSVTTFVKVIEACGFAMDVTLNRRIREHNGLPRGDELQQVLDLADQFPARPGKHLDFPKFERRT